jgi:hypothetical protein
MKRGNYFKLVGGYEGVVWMGKRWERFDCQRCVILKGIAAGAPLQGPMTKRAVEAMLGPVHHRHDVAAHAEWIRSRAAQKKVS